MRDWSSALGSSDLLYGLVELARANCIHAAAREGQDDFVTAAAAARLSATDAYDSAARDCVQIHGGIGVTWEIGLHLHMRRARSLAIEPGRQIGRESGRERGGQYVDNWGGGLSLKKK